MEQHAWLPDYISEANLFVHVNRGRGENCISVIRFMVVALPQSSVVTLCFGPRYMSWHSAMWNSAFGCVGSNRGGFSLGHCREQSNILHKVSTLKGYSRAEDENLRNEDSLQKASKSQFYHDGKSRWKWHFSRD
ncbi:conserved hypothetical protein [Coccidioides posadasii str. Silveira]|uniref:Uncharacterized protein n=1 Tax=Coccidioides posadasii (strain RMSCC 757 / Silveira) TaxID=443226 RepID=E9CYZ3_COCPS|nr:conserved hypothetical protein [Coccidioides posadasii str. Silveira]